MNTTRFELRLPCELALEAERIAREADITTGQLVRDLLAREIVRRNRAKPPIRADERLVAPLRARLAGDLAHSTDWANLQARLKTKGYVLREAGGGLALHAHPDGRRICKASELGFSYGRLMQRFRAAFPGHAHQWLEREFEIDAPPLDADDDPDVFEPFD